MHRTYAPSWKAPTGQNAYRREIKAPVRIKPDVKHAYPPWYHFGVYTFMMSRSSSSRWYERWMNRRRFWRDPDTGKYRR
jgi:hypothetical protein